MIEPHKVVAQVKIINTEYVGFIGDKMITRSKNLEKVFKKLASYVKGNPEG